MSRKPTHASPLISRVEFRERIKAFAITAFTVFILSCLVWPLSVTGFRSVAGINLQSNAIHSKQQLEKLLVDAVQQEADSERLGLILSEIEATGITRTRTIEERDFEAIRKSIQIGVKKQGDTFRLRVVFDGEGRPDERRFIDILTTRVAERLATPPRPNAEPLLAHSLPRQDYEQATQTLDQFESDLARITSSLQQPSDSNRFSLDRDDQRQQSRFQFASDKRRTESGDNDLNHSLETINLESMRELVEQLKSQMGVQDETAHSAAAGAALKVESLNRSRTRPIGGTPGLPMLLVLATMAGVAGSIVAWHCDPFGSRGFRTTSEIENRLAIPVLATLQTSALPGNSGTNDIASTKQNNWANRIVNLASLVLFGVFVVVAGFVLTNMEIRQAFFENPFFGFAKIVRLFAGY